MSYFDLISPTDVEVITGHVSEETARVVDDYPYGGHRTQIRYWIETVKGKGDRFCSQTLNPKTGRWNKPKKSTYTPVRFMTLHPQDDGRMFVKAEAAMSLYTSAKHLREWVSFVKEYGLPEQRKQFAYIYAVALATEKRKNS